MHFRIRINCFSRCRELLSTERISQEVSFSAATVKEGTTAGCADGCAKRVYEPLQRLSKV